MVAFALVDKDLSVALLAIVVDLKTIIIALTYLLFTGILITPLSEPAGIVYCQSI